MILFVSNADTELLAVRSIVDELPEGFGEVRWAHPERLAGIPDLAGTRAVVVRLLGGARAWEAPLRELLDVCAARAIAVVALGGEAEPDAELADMSTAPAGIVAEAHRYLAAGGPSNIAQMLRFVSDTLLLTGHGFAAPEELASHGVWEGAGVGAEPQRRDRRRPLVGVLFYRAHLVAGNTDYVAALCDAVERAGGDALAVYTYSLRSGADGGVPALETCARAGVDVLATSIFAAGGAAGDHGDQWEVPQLANLGVPVIQAPASSSSQSHWTLNEAGALAAGRGHGSGHPGVRRPRRRTHVRLQGGGRRRALRRAGLDQGQHRASRPAGRAGHEPCRAETDPARRQAGGRGVVGLSHQTGQARQRRRSRHPRERDSHAASAGRSRLRPGTTSPMTVTT